MTDRPILFSAPMVRSNHDGRKTNTRRILKPQPLNQSARMCGFVGIGDTKAVFSADYPNQPETIRLPISVGDRLWVRETWKPGAWRDDGRIAIDYRAHPELTNTPWCNLPESVNWRELQRRWNVELLRAGSVPDASNYHHWNPGRSPMRWRPGIHMPRWASRQTLIVTNLKIERLQNITEIDAVAEGVEPLYGGWFPYGISTFMTTFQDGREVPAQHCTSARDSFRMLWEHINGKGSWDANPWIIAYTYRTINRNIDQIEVQP